MMSSTFGAPFGGTTRGGHHGVDSVARCLITPPNFAGGAGSCFPSIVVVALAEPSWPVTTCAPEALDPAKKLDKARAPIAIFRVFSLSSIQILHASRLGFAPRQ